MTTNRLDWDGDTEREMNDAEAERVKALLKRYVVMPDPDDDC